MSDPIKNLEFQFNSLNLLDNVKKEGAMKARYIWGADGSKRAVADAAASNGFEYFGSFVFTKTASGLESESAAFPEGRFMAASTVFATVFHVTDHLGSVRAEIDGSPNMLRTVNDYMPYGTRFSTDGHGELSRYQFSGKERQTIGTTGAANDMELLDFGARMYDPSITRWLTQDPLAERYYSTSPYAYCANNPIRYIDPNGMDVYHFDEKKGEMVLHTKTDDDFDQIGDFKRIKNKQTKEVSYELKTNKKGEAKTKIDNIEKGILRDGMNLKDNDNVFNISGDGQATLAGFESFAVKFSDMIDKEIAGFYLTPKDNDNISQVYMGKYISNTDQRSFAVPRIYSVRPDLNGRVKLNTSFHTHLTKFPETDRTRPSGLFTAGGDIAYKQSQVGNGIKRFIILTKGYSSISY